jgi:hypothetical protein
MVIQYHPIRDQAKQVEFLCFVQTREDWHFCTGGTSATPSQCQLTVAQSASPKLTLPSPEDMNGYDSRDFSVAG